MKIYSFYLSIPLSHKSFLVPGNIAIFIRFVLEDPFSSNDIYSSWYKNKFPHFISLELSQLLLHSINLIFISQCFFDIYGFYFGNETRIGYVFRGSSGDTFIWTSYDVILRMDLLNPN